MVLIRSCYQIITASGKTLLSVFVIAAVSILSFLCVQQASFAQARNGQPLSSVEPEAVSQRGQRMASPFMASTTIQRIRNRGDLLVVGVSYDYAPFGTLDASGSANGFEPELVRALAEAWGVDVTFVPVAPAARIQSLLAGQVDLIAATLPHTVAHEIEIDFSNHYFVDTAALLLTVESQSLNFEDLSGRTIAIVQGETSAAYLEEYLSSASTTVTLLPFQEHAPALRALAAGQADALLANYTYLTNVAAAQSPLSVILPLAGEEAFGFGVAPGDSLFRDLVDATLQELYTSGTYAAVFARWFPNQPVPTLPLVAGEWPHALNELPTFDESRSEEAMHSAFRELQQNGLVRVGVYYDLPPFGFIDETGAVQGFEVDLAREFALRWFGTPDALALVSVTPDTAIPLLAAGQIDLAVAALAHTWQNEVKVDFSLPYYADGLGVLVQDGTPALALSELDQRPVAVVGATAMQAQAGILFGTTTHPLLFPFQEYRAAEQALLAKQVDGLLGNTTVLAQSQQQYPQLQLLAEQRRSQVYGVGIPAFDDQMRDLVNFTLQVMKLDGTYDTIYRKWFDSTPFPMPVWPGFTTAMDLRITAAAQQAPLLQSTAAVPPSLSIQSATMTATLPAPTPVVRTPPTAQALSILVPTAFPADTEPIDTPPPTVTPETATTEPAAPRVTTATALSTTPAVAAVQLRFPSTVTVLSTVSINARAQPSTDASILSLVGGGTRWPALALSNDGAWVQILLPSGIRGWVARRLLVEADQFVGADDLTTESVSTPTPVALPTIPTVSVTAPAQEEPAPTPTLRLLFATATSHRITATDTLASIAQQYYGEQRLWTIIYDANRTIIGEDPNVIPVGAELVIPPKP